MTLSRDLMHMLLSNSDVWFDSAEMNNGLYLCFAGEPGADVVESVVARLQEADAWYGELKSIPAERKSAYIEQLAFTACFAAAVDGLELVVLRADHSKFPTREGSWEKWCTALAAA